MTTTELVGPLRICRECDLEAWTEKDLEQFLKRRASKHRRRNICKKCHYEIYKKKIRKIKVRPEKPYLRKCGVCGIEAKTEDQLGLFKKDKRYLYGRKNTCRQCSIKDIVKRREIIKSLGRPIHCYFCGKEITKLEGCNEDSLIIHSIDHNHDNWDPFNKVPVHWSCHTSHHKKGIKQSRS